MGSWTLQPDGGDEKTLEAWGVDAISRSLRSLDVGTLTLTIPGSATDAAPFANRQAVTLRRDRNGAGTVWADGSIFFYGLVIHRSAAGSDAAESIVITLADPWWHLENKVYEQVFNCFSAWVDGIPGGTPIFVEKSTSHVTLNQDIDGGVWGTRAQLEDILDWAIAEGAPLDYDAGTFPDLKIPLREEKDITCAEAIRRQLDYMDAVAWFDYTTTPPKLKIKRRGDCTAVNAGAPLFSAIQLKPREELKVPFVHLKFEKTYEDSGGSFTAPPVDQFYPDPLPADKFGGLLATIVLAPSQSTTVEQYIEAGTLAPNTLDFWKAAKPELTDPDKYADLAIIADSAQVIAAENAAGYVEGDPVALNYYLLPGSGQIADWMNKDAVTVDVSVEISYKVKEELSGGNKIDLFKMRTQRINVKRIATNATTGLYQSRTTLDPGEDPAEFAGLAQAIYTDLNTLGWDGSLSRTDSECPGTIGIGNVVNLTGAAAEWTTMNALVQAVTENLLTGETQLELGVNKHLSAGQLVDLLRINRTRFFFRFGSRMSGTYGRPNTVSLPRKSAENNTTEAPKHYEEHSVSSKSVGNEVTRVQLKASTANAPELSLHTTTNTGAVDATKSRINIKTSALTAGQEAKFHPFQDLAGVTQYVLATAPITGTGGNFRGEYLSTAEYRVGDIVVVASGANAGTYICVFDLPGAAHAPWAGGGYWIKFFSGNALGQWM